MSVENETPIVEGSRVSHAEDNTVQVTEGAQDGDSASADSAHDSAQTESPHELRTSGLDVAAAVRDARASVADAGVEMNALTIGHTSERLQAALEPIRAAIYHATLADLGLSENGPQRPTETQRMSVHNLAALDVLSETFWTWIADRGVMTSKGRTRSAVNTWLSIVDRQTKLAAASGLERCLKPVATLEDVLRGH